MKTFKIISVIASLLFSIAIASAQNTKNKNTEKTERAKTNPPLIIEFKDTEIRGSEILSRCEEMKNQILQSDKILDSGALSLTVMWFDEFSKHPKIEEETNIRKEWFTKVSKEAEKLQYIAYKYECAKEEPDVEGHPAIIKKAPEKYKEILKSFKNIIEHPDKISKKKK